MYPFRPRALRWERNAGRSGPWPDPCPIPGRVSLLRAPASCQASVSSISLDQPWQILPFYEPRGSEKVARGQLVSSSDLRSPALIHLPSLHVPHSARLLHPLRSTHYPLHHIPKTRSIREAMIRRSSPRTSITRHLSGDSISASNARAPSFIRRALEHGYEQLARPRRRVIRGGQALVLAAAARSSWAMSNFTILSIASPTRFAFSRSGSAMSSASTLGTICQERPYLSLSQPHCSADPPSSSACR